MCQTTNEINVHLLDYQSASKNQKHAPGIGEFVVGQRFYNSGGRSQCTGERSLALMLPAAPLTRETCLANIGQERNS